MTSVQAAIVAFVVIFVGLGCLILAARRARAMTRVFVPQGIEVTPRPDRPARRATLDGYVLDGDLYVPEEGAQAVGWLVDPRIGCETLQSFRERLLGFPRRIVQVMTESGWVAHAEAIVEIR